MDGGACTIVGMKGVRRRGFVRTRLIDVRFVLKNVEVSNGFFFVAVESCEVESVLRLIVFLTVSQELTRSGSSAGSINVVFVVVVVVVAVVATPSVCDCGMYQSLFEISERRILTFNFGSTDGESHDDDAGDVAPSTSNVALGFSGTSISNEVASMI